MKRNLINMRYTILFLSIIICGLMISAPASPENKFRLKTGAKGEICLKCHEGFKEKLKDRFVHTPVKTGECSGCHNPHTSYYGNLLDNVSERICLKCHQKERHENARSAHTVVMEGNCTKCHDPHASNNRSVLLKSGNELCFDCHADMGNKVKSVRFKHKPVNENCLECHDPHASAKFAFLLKDDTPAICIKCHKVDKPSFIKQHMNYPVAASKCDGCHDSHGSNKAVIVYETVHDPVAKKKCGECHADPASPSPLAIKKDGVELCRECHKSMVEETFNKNRIHWPLLDRSGCLNCHNAHAAKQTKLLTESVRGVCGKCHKDTTALQEISINNPKNPGLCKPVKEGNCIDCHSPHAADNILLVDKPSMSYDVCGKCHNWQAHSTHPLGEKFIDQRNKNLSVDCMSCHRACGTGNKPRMTHFDTITETCVQCHQELRR